MSRARSRCRSAPLDYSTYVGVIGIGRVTRGVVTPRMPVAVVSAAGVERRARVLSVHANRGLERVELPSAEAGDIVCISGIDDVGVSDTICDINAVDPLPALAVDEPTLTMMFRVNTSPFAGREGKYLTSRQIRERLLREASHNVALRVEETDDPDQFQVSGRGELHLSVLLETMRREGYECAVSRPTVIMRVVDGERVEPFETVAFDIESEHQGRLMEVLGERKGELVDMQHDGAGRVRLTSKLATRALLGFRAVFTSLTSGSGIMTFSSAGYGPVVPGLQTGRVAGVLISKAKRPGARGLRAVQPAGARAAHGASRRRGVRRHGGGPAQALERPDGQSVAGEETDQHPGGG